MVSKEQCIENVVVIVNNKQTKFYSEFNVDGLIAFPFGSSLGSEIVIPVGTKLIILSKPKTYKHLSSGKQVKFKLENDETILSSWWMFFKPKVDLV